MFVLCFFGGVIFFFGGGLGVVVLFNDSSLYQLNWFQSEFYQSNYTMQCLLYASGYAY